MLRKFMLGMCLVLIGSAFWIPADVHALYVTLKCPAGTIYKNGLCVKTGSVEVEGSGNTQGATTTAYVVVKPDSSQGVIVVCRNRGGNIGSGKAFLPSDIDLSSSDAEKPKLVDKKGKFAFGTDDILPAGIHPEYTPEQCQADLACAAIQTFCPNGVPSGDGKNWVPVDVTPIVLKVQGFLYYCDSDKGTHICACDPKLDATDSGQASPVSATSPPQTRCASATDPKTSTNTWTFAWTDVSGPFGVPDSISDHYDIVPGAQTPVYSCVLPNPQDFFYGAKLPYECTETTLANLFP
jgi:hypothetical protein